MSEQEKSLSLYDIFFAELARDRGRSSYAAEKAGLEAVASHVRAESDEKVKLLESLIADRDSDIKTLIAASPQSKAQCDDAQKRIAELEADNEQAIALLQRIVDGVGCQPGYINSLGLSAAESFLHRMKYAALQNGGGNG